jgi:hypothetical protein
MSKEMYIQCQHKHTKGRPPETKCRERFGWGANVELMMEFGGWEKDKAL